MKISSIQNNNFSQNRNQTNQKSSPSFNARVNVIFETTKDVISQDYLTINKEPLRTLAEKIRPHLEKIMDDNLLIDVTAAGRPMSFWNLFRSHAEGLKFDMRFHDIKRYYYEVLMKDKDLEKFIEPQQYKGIMEKDSTLLSGLMERVCVGRLYEPQKGDTPEKFINDVIPKIKEHLRLFPKFLTERRDFEYEKDTKKFVKIGSYFPYGERLPWERYRGIEFDYPQVFKEYYNK